MCGDCRSMADGRVVSPENAGSSPVVHPTGSGKLVLRSFWKRETLSSILRGLTEKISYGKIEHRASLAQKQSIRLLSGGSRWQNSRGARTVRDDGPARRGNPTRLSEGATGLITPSARVRILGESRTTKHALVGEPGVPATLSRWRTRVQISSSARCFSPVVERWIETPQVVSSILTGITDR